MNWIQRLFKQDDLKPDLRKLINSQNKHIWYQCKKKFKIDVRYNIEDEYSVHILPNKATIRVQIGNYCPASFTHELLHLYLRYKGLNLSHWISKNFSSINHTYPRALIDHITNCLDHAKMLPIYLDLGFEKRLFLKDYFELKCSDTEIRLISVYINSPLNWHFATEHFIKSFFAMKACPNEDLTLEHNQYLYQLKSLEGTLYNILDSFWNKWLLLNIDQNNNEERCLALSMNFIEDIKSWSRNK
jgi:hypothetical protein